MGAQHTYMFMMIVIMKMIMMIDLVHFLKAIVCDTRVPFKLSQ